RRRGGGSGGAAARRGTGARARAYAAARRGDARARRDGSGRRVGDETARSHAPLRGGAGALPGTCRRTGRRAARRRRAGACTAAGARPRGLPSVARRHRAVRERAPGGAGHHRARWRPRHDGGHRGSGRRLHPAGHSGRSRAPRRPAGRGAVCRPRTPGERDGGARLGHCHRRHPGHARATDLASGDGRWRRAAALITGDAARSWREFARTALAAHFIRITTTGTMIPDKFLRMAGLGALGVAPGATGLYLLFAFVFHPTPTGGAPGSGGGIDAIGWWVLIVAMLV